MPRLFDAYIIVDWSAAAKPVTGANSIWIGVLSRDENARLQFHSENPPTRRDARQRIRHHAESLIARGDKILIGFDFAMGYPAGTAQTIGLDTASVPPWKAIHEYIAQHIIDTVDNSNCRFEFAANLNANMTGSAHPFWGAPASKVCSTLSRKKGDFTDSRSPSEHRIAEAWVRGNFKANPKSVWQLLGAGAVGSQSLMGVPTVSYLRAHIGAAKIWPFETGLRRMSPKYLEITSCLLAEIYPSTLTVTPKSGEVFDQAQVRALSKHLESLDSTGKLGAAFDAPDSISDREIHKIIGEEGWILAK